MDKNSNVNLLAKRSQKNSKFGENLHYLTDENIQRLWDVIDNYEHKLMLRLVYELGCRVGEFVQIRLATSTSAKTPYSSLLKTPRQRKDEQAMYHWVL